MKGYFTNYCYMGWLPSMKVYFPFVTEKEYVEFYKEWEEEK